RFLSVAREQQPELLRPANEAADLAEKLPLMILAPATAMTALHRQTLTREPKLLVKLREPLRLPALPLQRRMLRHKIHAAEQPAEILFQTGFCGAAIHATIIIPCWAELPACSDRIEVQARPRHEFRRQFRVRHFSHQAF